jgi:hypothetical protein
MEPFEKDELTDRELDAMLPAWKSPPAPVRLRAAVFGDVSMSTSGWRKFWNTSFRLPLPVACGLAMLLAFGMWRWFMPAPTRIVIQTERVEVPVVKKEIVTVYQDRIVYAPAARTVVNPHQLQAVVELQPRIIRREDAQN